MMSMTRPCDIFGQNRAQSNEICSFGREFKKKVLTLPTILKITNGLNGYHRNW